MHQRSFKMCLYLPLGQSLELIEPDLAAAVLYMYIYVRFLSVNWSCCGFDYA